MLIISGSEVLVLPLWRLDGLFGVLTPFDNQIPLPEVLVLDQVLLAVIFLFVEVSIILDQDAGLVFVVLLQRLLAVNGLD